MTEARELGGLALRTSPDGDVLNLAERIYTRLVTRTGNALNPRHALEDAASALRAADTFYRAADEWFTTRHAVAAAAAVEFEEHCDDRR